MLYVCTVETSSMIYSVLLHIANLLMLFGSICILLLFLFWYLWKVCYIWKVNSKINILFIQVQQTQGYNVHCDITDRPNVVLVKCVN